MGLDGKEFVVANMQAGTNAPPLHPFCRCSTSAKGGILPDVELRAKALVNEASLHEPSVTDTLNSIAEETGTSLKGLENKLKTQESLARKLQDEGVDKPIRDVLRYTSVSDTENHVETIENFFAKLQEAGYNRSEVKNYWNVPDNPYNGVNTNWINPQGYEFEIQFHTRHNLQVKDDMHRVYKEFRQESDIGKRNELTDQMKEIGDTYIRPPGVDEIE